MAGTKVGRGMGRDKSLGVSQRIRLGLHTGYVACHMSMAKAVLIMVLWSFHITIK